jgi:hypothetical protein
MRSAAELPMWVTRAVRQCQGGPWLGCDLVCLPAAVSSCGPARPASTRPTVRQWFVRPAKRPHRPACGRADGRTCHPSRRHATVRMDRQPARQSTCARVLLDSIAERQRWHDQTAVGQAYRSGWRDLNSGPLEGFSPFRVLTGCLGNSRNPSCLQGTRRFAVSDPLRSVGVAHG